MSKGLKIATVTKGSIADEMELEPGDRIIAIDDQEIKDIIDFQFATAEEQFVCLVEKQNGEYWEIDIEREHHEELGLAFDSVDVAGLKMCHNNCVFCFVAQTPKKMRPTLYQKDDDYRLSLTQGSFITLSNITDQEFERIIRLHLSPLYISVHAWDPETRVKMMRNPRAANLPEQIRRLADAGITMHVQIVLVPGYNDEEILQETVEQLGKHYPQVQSIGVVPVGLTKHRERLTELRPVTREEAQKIIDTGHRWQEQYFKTYGIRLVYFSDEFYVLAGRDFPEAFTYDGFPQLENGIGMAALFLEDLKNIWPHLPKRIEERRVHLITGMSAQHYFELLSRRLAQVEGLELKLHIIKNRYFGETVTVAGLLTAQDIAEQVGNINGEVFLIPRHMLKADEEIFLDDHSVAWLEERINGKAVIVENNAYSFIQGLLDQEVQLYE